MYSSRLARRPLEMLSVTYVTGPGINGKVRSVSLTVPASTGKAAMS